MTKKLGGAPNAKALIALSSVAKSLVDELVAAGDLLLPAAACYFYILAGSSSRAVSCSYGTGARLLPPCPLPCSAAAMAVAEERGEGTPLQPAHIHAAYQRLVEADKVPGRPSGRRPFL